MQQWGETNSLSLQLLTLKVMILLSLTRPSRSADLVSLNVDHCQYKPEGVVFQPSSLAKQSRQSKSLLEYYFASFLIINSFGDFTAVSAGYNATEERA